MTRFQKYFVFWLVMFAGLLLFFSLKEILLPFVAGIVVAYFLDPLLDYLENVGLSRMVAATMITSIFFFIDYNLTYFTNSNFTEATVGFVWQVAPNT